MTGHPDYVALLAACCERPDDDTPRLVLADWLDDHGQGGRAAFIRREVGRFAQLSDDDRELGGSHPKVCGWAVHGPVERWYWGGDGNSRFWRKGEIRLVTQGIPADEHVVIGFRRGFSSEIKCPAAWWVAHGDALSWSPAEARPCPPTACPGVVVRLTDFPTYQWQLANTPPGWPLHTRPTGRRYVALDCLEHRWPGVRAWHLPEPLTARRIPAMVRVPPGLLDPPPGRQVVRFVGGPFDGRVQDMPTTDGRLSRRYVVPVMPAAMPRWDERVRPGDRVRHEEVEYTLNRYSSGDGRQVPVYVAPGATDDQMRAADEWAAAAIERGEGEELPGRRARRAARLILDGGAP